MYCTISTSAHLFKTLALAESLNHFDCRLSVLVLDSDKISEEWEHENVDFFLFDKLPYFNSSKAAKKYKGDQLRWSLKPLFIKFLLQSQEQVKYIDNDIYFYKDPSEINLILEKYDIILSPHWYPHDPSMGGSWFEANFRLGLFNAGFIGANQNAIPAMDWWYNCCVYEMRKLYFRGLFDDQKYLDLLPVLFDNVHILKSNKYNFASWNQHLKLDIEEIVFIHFNKYTLAEFSQESSSYKALTNKYLSHLRKFKSDYSIANKTFNTFDVKNAFWYLKYKFSKFISF